MDIVNAISTKNILRVIELLDNGINPNTTYGPFHYPILHLSLYSTRSNDPDGFKIFNKLIERGANINLEDDKGNTVVYLCVMYGRIEPLLQLLEMKVNIYSVRHDKKTCLTVSNRYKEDFSEKKCIYDLLCYADSAFYGNIQYIKSNLLLKKFDIPIKAWINYLSIESCMELLDWLGIIPKKVYYLADKNTGYIQKQVSNLHLIAQNINSYLEYKYISNLRLQLSTKN